MINGLHFQTINGRQLVKGSVFRVLRGSDTDNNNVFDPQPRQLSFNTRNNLYSH